MAAYIQRLHHISLHVSNADKIAGELVSKFKFNLFAARLRDKCRQFAFRKGRAVFVVNEARSRLNESSFEDVHAGNGCIYDAGPRYALDTAANVCFEVEDVQRSFQTLRQMGCSFLVPPTTLRDVRGAVTYSVVKSLVGNVRHTLIDTSAYGGRFLPGFEAVDEASEGKDDPACPVTHFDHVTYACPRKFTRDVMVWYERCFGFQRFFIGSNEDLEEGLVLDQEDIGLRLTAMEYWKCSERGLSLPRGHQREPDCKFVIAESLPKQGRNQVDRFLEEHRGAGIQHIGLYTTDIVSTAQRMGQAGVLFFRPPPAYYSEVGKQQEILDAGHSPELLSQHGILLDTDLQQSERSEGREPRYLLQVFTQPLFSEDTFFLELIERRGASGFGEGNIRALWRSVQRYMEKEGNDASDDTTLQSAKS
ncbi:4-hydroxyphenylpyruvate dioxygenase-like protein [Eucyclogobius newberryi]|uniref:4-hydroxyphenylpyruvate dioxygenase-like protein n=1 Tax=Eucyclogobius newberryi TaxID=166745 RepID=UPI003B5CA33E